MKPRTIVAAAMLAALTGTAITACSSSSPGGWHTAILGDMNAPDQVIGKTTTLRGIASLVTVRGGRITLAGRELTGRPPHVIARAGVAYVPSGRRVFSQLTVAQNLKLAARSCPARRGPWTTAQVYAVFPKLAELAGRGAGLLSGGEQQMLKLGRALLTQPDVLLLDEPTEGLSPLVVRELGGWLERLRDEGLSVLLTEQSAAFALRHASRGYILEKGQVRAGGPAGRLRDSTELHELLGVGQNEEA